VVWNADGEEGESHQKGRKTTKGEKLMKKQICQSAVVAMGAILLMAGVVGAQQFPILDDVANKVVQKYQQASCEDLWKKKGQPKSEMEQRVIKMLQSDPQMRQEFINRVAAPIANKMFECGMIP
jgi:hypothetical protein